MSTTKQKLRLIGAFAVLGTLALAVGCRGFFQNPTLTAINIAPSTPEVELNNTLALSVFGTYNDGSTAQVTSGVSWSSSDEGVASFTTPTSNVLQGLTLGTSTITANAQAVTATAQATVFLGSITAITVNPKTGAISQSNPDTAATFTAMATSNGTQVDITDSATWTVSPSTTGIACSNAGSDTPETCTSVSGNSLTPGSTYSLIVSYPGTTLTATATITVGT